MDKRLWQETILKKSPNHHSHELVTYYVVVILLLLSIVWTVYLTVNQAHLNEQLSKLEVNQERLLALVSSNCHTQSKEINSVTSDRILWRVRREADGGAKVDPEKQKVKGRGRRRRKVKGAHFIAYYDHDRALRERAEGLSPSVGNLTVDGLVLTGQIYNIWKPLKWNNMKNFQFNATNGKVKVKSSGLYLIYSQVMFHSPYARKSYGIHINDETKPFIEALSYHTSHRYTSKKVKRDTSLADPQPYDTINGLVEMTAHEYSSHQHSSRHKRSSSSTYSQCNTMAVAYLNRNDEVFLKSLESHPVVIPTSYLTFWGLVKL